ncbi:MAG: SPOR domain-containing protein [Treponema sp.]|nr:SPOR domain-containing protein [Treponema sp.]
MKKTLKSICFGICICVSLLIFVSSSVWEGAAAVGMELPESGLFVATNSFPPNTIADITNLENGLTIQVTVTGGLESSALLALLSRDTAGALGLEEQSLGRIRMIQSNERLAASHFNRDWGDEAPADNTAENIIEEELVLVPSEPRPPDGPVYIDPSLIVAPVESQPVESQPAASQPPAAVYQSSPHSPFSVPLISRLEPEMYYIQLAAFSRVEAVQNEIAQIDSYLPVVVMSAGTEREPIYRVLVGPVNLGESGALLHRFRVSHRDAFVRMGD